MQASIASCIFLYVTTFLSFVIEAISGICFVNVHTSLLFSILLIISESFGIFIEFAKTGGFPIIFPS